jgi:hypothetical protein
VDDRALRLFALLSAIGGAALVLQSLGAPLWRDLSIYQDYLCRGLPSDYVYLPHVSLFLLPLCALGPLAAPVVAVANLLFLAAGSLKLAQKLNLSGRWFTMALVTSPVAVSSVLLGQTTPLLFFAASLVVTGSRSFVPFLIASFKPMTWYALLPAGRRLVGVVAAVLLLSAAFLVLRPAALADLSENLAEVQGRISWHSEGFSSVSGFFSVYELNKHPLVWLYKLAGPGAFTVAKALAAAALLFMAYRSERKVLWSAFALAFLQNVFWDHYYLLLLPALASRRQLLPKALMLYSVFPSFLAYLLGLGALIDLFPLSLLGFYLSLGGSLAEELGGKHARGDAETIGDPGPL